MLIWISLNIFNILDFGEKAKTCFLDITVYMSDLYGNMVVTQNGLEPTTPEFKFKFDILYTCNYISANVD